MVGTTMLLDAITLNGAIHGMFNIQSMDEFEEIKKDLYEGYLAEESNKKIVQDIGEESNLK